MTTLKRIWLWIDGYCWPHTVRWCVPCHEARRERLLAKYRKKIRHNDDMAYEIRLERCK